MPRPWRPWIVSHRGWGKPLLPENSREAFAWSHTHGFPVVECDAWSSADGQPVVLHDETLDRTTTASGPVAALTVAQLRQVRLKTSGSQADFHLPLLADVADLVSVIEVKPANDAHLVRQVISVMGSRSWLFQSFDPANVACALVEMPSLRAALLIDDPAGIEIALSHRWTAHMHHALCIEPHVRRLRDAGIQLGVWTVNRREDLQRLIPFEPEIVITDEPLMVQQTLMSAGIAPAEISQWGPVKPLPA